LSAAIGTNTRSVVSTRGSLTAEFEGLSAADTGTTVMSVARAKLTLRIRQQLTALPENLNCELKLP